jgi:hypothetical protein
VFRRFLIAVVIFLIAVVVVADRVGAIVGAHVLAGKVQTDEGLSSRPSATIGGFPFLTQAIGGNYKDVTITADNVTVNGLTVTKLTAHLHHVHLPLGKVIHGSVTQVPVGQVAATAFVAFSDINEYLHNQHLSLQVSPATGDNVTLTERVAVHGKHVSVSGVGSVTVSNNVIHVRVTKVSGVSAPGGQSLRFSLPLKGIPFRIQVQSVSTSSTGLTATGGASNIVLGARGPLAKT